MQHGMQSVVTFNMVCNDVYVFRPQHVALRHQTMILLEAQSEGKYKL